MSHETALMDFARQLHEWGANVTAIKRGAKRPDHPWEPWQHGRQTSDELENLPWARAAAVGIVNGSGGFRVFDIDAPKDSDGRPLYEVPIEVLHTILRAIGLPTDYQWAYVSGSGAGYGIVFRCNDEMPAGWGAHKGIYQATSREGFKFHHLELRWGSGQTVIAGAHPTGPGYRWLRGEPPFVLPAMVKADAIVAGFTSIAESPDKATAATTTVSQTTNRYGQAALAHAIRIVSTAEIGTRNDTLFRETAGLVKLVNGGKLGREEVEAGLAAAALVAGLPEAEARATIASAFKRVTASRTARMSLTTPNSPLPLGDSEAPASGLAEVDFRSYQPEDGGILDAWLELYGHNWIYIDELTEWHRWTGTHWQQDTNALRLKDQVMDLLQHFNAAAGAARRSVTGEERKQLTAYINATKRTATRVGSIEQMARIRRRVPVHEVNQIEALNLLNGTLDLQTFDLRLHAREDLLTNCLPYHYDPNTEAPTWQEVVGRLEPEVAAFVQEYAGYALTTDTQHEVALWLYGPPGSGKSTFLAGMQAMLGPLAIALGLADVMNSRFALARLPGKTLAIATEQPADYLPTTHMLNALISGEPVQVDRKYRDAVEIKPVAKLAWAMNDLPRMKGGNDGLFRRVQIVGFPALAATERQSSFKDAVVQEAPGILNWALAGLRRLRQRGRFEVPAQIVSATADFAKQNDIPSLFLDECCERGEDFKVTSKELYLRYEIWCYGNGHRPQSSTAVARDWTRLGLERTRTSSGTVWRGARLLELAP